jgi:hypothetical protein
MAANGISQHWKTDLSSESCCRTEPACVGRETWHQPRVPGATGDREAAVPGVPHRAYCQRSLYSPSGSTPSAQTGGSCVGQSTEAPHGSRGSNRESLCISLLQQRIERCACTREWRSSCADALASTARIARCAQGTRPSNCKDRRIGYPSRVSGTTARE